jgi:hypothetical protein
MGVEHIVHGCGSGRETHNCLVADSKLVVHATYRSCQFVLGQFLANCEVHPCSRPELSPIVVIQRSRVAQRKREPTTRMYRKALYGKLDSPPQRQRSFKNRWISFLGMRIRRSPGSFRRTFRRTSRRTVSSQTPNSVAVLLMFNV